MSCMGGITHTHLHPMCVAVLPLPPPSSPPPPHAHTLMASVRMAGDALCGAAMPMRADGLRQGKRSVCPPNQCVWMRAISGVSGRRHAQTMMWYLWQANHIRGSIVVSISACHADDPGSIPGRGALCGKPLSGAPGQVCECHRHTQGWRFMRRCLGFLHRGMRPRLSVATLAPAKRRAAQANFGNNSALPVVGGRRSVLCAAAFLCGAATQCGEKRPAQRAASRPR